jgi:hypothetical protein
MTMCRPVPVIHGDDVCPAPKAFVGDDIVTMNQPLPPRARVAAACFRGPQTMLPWLREIRAAVSRRVDALPVPYRTTDAELTLFNLSDPSATVPSPHGRTFPTALDPLYANRYEVGAFAP